MKQVGMFDNGKTCITVWGTNEQPWFVSKEISRILGIQNHRNVLRTLQGEDKTILNDSGRAQCLISESGLFVFFVYAPKNTGTIEFQRWVTRDILPSIRLRQIYKQQQVIQQLEHFIENIKTRQKAQVIYIATSNRYANQNIFKVGGCSSEELLSKRLITYNTGRIGEDELYYVSLFKCDNHNHMEARIKELLYEFRHAKEKEMYVIHYASLQRMIQQMIHHYNDEVDGLNKLIHNLSQHVLEESHAPKPVPPFPKSIKTKLKR
jgi:prophage antirepressor-like protein